MILKDMSKGTVIEDSLVDLDRCIMQIIFHLEKPFSGSAKKASKKKQSSEDCNPLLSTF